MSRCRDCNCGLTFSERLNYEYRCEACEWKWNDAVEAWRHGRGPRPHETTRDCWCHPTRDAKEPSVWVHNQIH